MKDDEIKERFFHVWVVIAILIFASNMHSLSFWKLSERVDAMEQSKQIEGQR